MGLWAQSSHEEQFTSKNRTIAEKRLYPPHQIKFVHVRAAENSAALILCEIMIYRQADCLIGSYSVNCSKKCHCLVGPCDSVTGACGNGGCIDGWLGISCNENPIRIAISSINVTTNAHIYNTDTTNADKVNDGVNGKSLDPWNCKCCAVLTLSSWLQLTLDKIYLVERVLVYANDISGSVDNITLSIGLREESLHDEHFTWKSKTTAEKLLHPPREIQFVRFTWSDYSQILCEIMIYRQADCPIGKYSVNCAKQCHCLVGPCDSVTGACGKELCEDEWKGTACNETKADTKLSSTVIWIATFLGLFLLLVGVTIAWLCIRRKKIGTVERTLENVQQNDLQPSYCPQEFHDNNYAQYEVVPDNISEREATPMYTSFQMKDKHLYTGLQNSSPMSPASPYVISESETVEKNYAEADDNASTSEAKNKLTEEKENDNNGETNYADFELLENDKQKSVHKEYYFVK
ncbi:uncharacterized protein LOC127879549 isoform X2 [Dreissena polymorpha]|nr:uncharacterized protein LOC127879549 isoform X2 [Dreissena polymorpha]XP_052282430.1 uncharacterized protein LOC127879549 isoform X2 [Dreissena polymorpha]